MSFCKSSDLDYSCYEKEKHKNMANNSELHKIEVEGRLIGVLNFNLMIPVTEAQLIPIDLKVHSNDTKYY
ncbi:MAG: type III toxin-antitoxin system ToxN/AbiQ family toxin [Lachnospiraceae bacterium]|nr:type III toxin-antitoxin system ToxN/AbiQ family toxin [Lachnospiraceae bacterium]